MTIQDEATKWWADMTKRGDYVACTDEIPDQRRRGFLVKQGFLSRVTKGLWILKRPEDGLEEVWPLLYWRVVDRHLSRFRDWSIRGRSALVILNGDERAQEELLVRTKTKTNRRIALALGARLSLVHDRDFDERLLRKVRVADRSLPLDVPERVLVDVAKAPTGADVTAFLAGTDFDLRTVEAIYATKPKPILFKRLMDLCSQVGRPELAEALGRIVEAHTHYQVIRRAAARETKAITIPKPDRRQGF